MTKTDQELLKAYKARIKRQNSRIRESYDKVTATLPKGTVDRIRALGLTVNGAINESLIAFLECLEEQDKTESSQTIHNVHASSKTEKLEKHTPTPTKAEIGANTAQHQDGKTEEADSSENNPVKAGFDGLKACEWNEEKHGGVVPHPPVGTPKNAIWDSSIGEWYEPLPF